MLLGMNKLKHAEVGFLNEAEVLERIPVSRSTLSTWKEGGVIPFIRVGRRCLYDWPSVKSALLQRQKGRIVAPW